MSNEITSTTSTEGAHASQSAGHPVCGFRESAFRANLDINGRVGEPNPMVLSFWPMQFRISYRFVNYTSQMPHYQQRLAIQYAFNKWRSVTNLKFTEVGTVGNITFQFSLGDHGDDDPFTETRDKLAHAFPPGAKDGRQGQVHFDDSQTWNCDTLKGVAMHEIGHALGLGHSPNKKSVMYKEFSGQTDLQPDETAAIQSCYQAYPDDDKFLPVYGRDNFGQGLGDFDLRDERDRGFAFDAGENRMEDHIVFYRPGASVLYIWNRFTTIYETHKGILGYDLMSDKDCALAFDYGSTHMKNHVVLYRPGAGKLSVMRFMPRRNHVGIFEEIYSTNTGLPGFDLKDEEDKVFPFDYESSGKTDHLVLYRPGQGLLVIVKPNGKGWDTVYTTAKRIGGYTLTDTRDRAFAFDYESSGKLNYIIIYRPGTGSICILKHEGSAFKAQYMQVDPGSGIGGFDLADPNHSAYAYDYDGSGFMDHIVFYGPGLGTFWVLKNHHTNWYPVYAQGDMNEPGKGVGTYDLTSGTDKSFAFDYDRNGKNNYIVLYRPNKGIIFICKRVKEDEIGFYDEDRPIP